ncbi:MAG TPA: RNA polymerase sigma factor [Methyloceanibacter sp.]|nr:RNA polymerase sigma factor [Methyloceanibacter sp.]
MELECFGNVRFLAAEIEMAAPVLQSQCALEAELINRAIGRDESAVRMILQQNNRRLYRLARSVVKDDSEAEDIVQAAYGRAFTRLDTFEGNSTLGTWLGRIVLNEALGRLRRHVETVELSTFEGERYNPALSTPVLAQADPERLTAQREICRLLESAIDDLPEPFRIVLMARAVEGLTVDETARLMGIKSAILKTRLHRARALLRTALKSDKGASLTEAFPFAGERCTRITANVLNQLEAHRNTFAIKEASSADSLRSVLIRFCY